MGPVSILVFSGKRKSGKDYLTEALKSRLTAQHCEILRLSSPLKEKYAEEHSLDFSKLLDSSDYKEKYRTDMIRWGEERRLQDPGYFCRIITSGPGSDKPVWIISDARRKTDVAWFKQHYGDVVSTVRVEAEEPVRVQRGWVFTPGVDDVESECGLDAGVAFDYHLVNNGDSVDEVLSNILADIIRRLSTSCQTDK